MELTFILQGKTISSFIGDESNLPKKNTQIKINNKKYLIYDFSISSDKIFYLIK